MASMEEMQRYYIWEEYHNGCGPFRQMGRMNGYPTFEEAEAEVKRMLEAHEGFHRNFNTRPFPRPNKLVILRARLVYKAVYGGGPEESAHHCCCYGCYPSHQCERQVCLAWRAKMERGGQ